MQQLPLPVRLRASSVFESYFPGPNTHVVEQLRALQPGERPIVIWAYGACGVGKTHLLQAICARAGQNKLSSVYLPLRDIGGVDADWLNGCETLSFICLDDFDTIAGRANWERALFRLYTELEDQGGRLVIAAEAAPAAYSIGLKDLASRFGAGMVLRLQALSDDELSSALALRAHQLGLELPQDTTQFLLRRLPREMTALCDALDTLDQASLANQRRLTVPFVRSVVGDVSGA